MSFFQLLDKIENTLKRFPSISKLIVLISVIITIFSFLDNYLQNAIHKQITDKDYINNISKSLRPYLLLNLDGNVVYDHGAYDFINFIGLQPDTIKLDNHEPFGIYIDFKKPMSNKPIIENLSPHEIVYESTRAGNTGWMFKFISNGYYKEFPNSDSILRIELIF